MHIRWLVFPIIYLSLAGARLLAQSEVQRELKRETAQGEQSESESESEAATEAESVTVLRLQSNEKQGGDHSIARGGKIEYWAIGDPSPEEGLIEDISDSAIVVAGRELLFSELQRIRTRASKQMWDKPWGFHLVVVGAIFAYVGLRYQSDASFLRSSKNPDVARFGYSLFILLIIIAFLGLLMAMIGAVMLLLNHIIPKDYDLIQTWKLSAFELEKKQKRRRRANTQKPKRPPGLLK